MRAPIFSRTISILSAAIAIATGIVVTAGYFLNLPGALAELGTLRQIFLDWAVTVAAIALLLGGFNLLSVHLGKIRAGGANALYSVVLVVSMAITFLLAAFLGPADPLPRWIFENIQLPVEASLMAVLAVSLAYAAARLLQRRTSIYSLLFVGAALLTLFGSGAFPDAGLPVLGDLLSSARQWLAQTPAAAGARGILLGIALGTVATGVRILMGADRPYGE